MCRVCCLLIVVCYLLFVVCWLLVVVSCCGVRCVLFVACRLVFVACCLMVSCVLMCLALDDGLLLVACCKSFDVLCVVWCALFVIRSSLFVVCR